MSAAPIIIIITRPRQAARGTEIAGQSLSENSQIQVLASEGMTDIEVLQAAIDQLQRDGA